MSNDVNRRLTAEIVSAYVGNHSIEAGEIPGLIGSVHRAIASIGVAAVPLEQIDPSVSIKRSLQPDRITCLDCGWHGKMVKRHIRNAHGLTPEQYRARWRLPSDYPMTASNYSKTRSALAKKLGLGLTRTPNGAETAESLASTTTPREGNLQTFIAAAHAGGKNTAKTKTRSKTAPKAKSTKPRAKKGTDAKSATA